MPSKPTYEELEQRVQELEDRDARCRQIEQAMHDVERRFRLSQKIARIGHVDYDVQTGAIYWSEMLYTLYGRDPALGPPAYEEVMAMHSPEEAEALERLVSEAVETGRSYVLDLHLCLPSGRKATSQSIGIPQKGADGKVVHIAGTVQDVTDQRKAEEALHESQHRTVEILESIDDAFYAVDADWRLVYVNRRTESLWGRSREGLVGTPLWELFPHEQETEAYRAHLRAMETRMPVQFEAFSPTLRFWVDASVYPTRDGGLSVYFRDVSARKEAEAALQESEQTFRSIFHEHAAVKLLLDPETGAIVEANRAAERFYGWSMAKLKTMRIQDINTLPLEQVRAEMKRARSLERSHFEFQHRLADGSIRDVEVYSSAIRAHGRDLLHSIVHDVSQRKRAERALHRAHEELELEVQRRTAELQAESDRRRYLAGRLVEVIEEDRRTLSMMLHDDIGQLLAGTKMELEGLGHDLADGGDPQLRGKLDQVSQTLQRILVSLREKSRQLRPSSLDTLGLAAALRSIDAGAGPCNIHHHIQEIPETMDPDLKLTVFRIAQEAVTNASRHAGCREIHLSLMDRDGRLILKVEDDGKGFSREEAMSGRAGEGPLGLLIMQERAVHANGKLHVESSPGRGTTVTAEFSSKTEKTG